MIFSFSYSFIIVIPYLKNKKQTQKKTLWSLLMDGVELPHGSSHYEEAVYFLPLTGR